MDVVFIEMSFYNAVDTSFFLNLVINKCFIVTRCWELQSQSFVFFVGLICGVTVAGVVLIAVIVIATCKIRLEIISIDIRH